jgi:hypothetical protein
MHKGILNMRMLCRNSNLRVQNGFSATDALATLQPLQLLRHSNECNAEPGSTKKKNVQGLYYKNIAHNNTSFIYAHQMVRIDALY